MYGYKGGRKDSCVYPTVSNVRKAFYDEYDAYGSEPLITYDPTKGDIPRVGEKHFRCVSTKVTKLVISNTVQVVLT